MKDFRKRVWHPFSVLLPILLLLAACGSNSSTTATVTATGADVLQSDKSRESSPDAKVVELQAVVERKQPVCPGTLPHLAIRK